MRRNGRVKKTYNLDPALIARAKRIFKAKTETEAITRALEDLAFMDELEKALRATRGKFRHFKPLR